MSEVFNSGNGGAVCDGCHYLVRTGHRLSPHRVTNREHVTLAAPGDRSDPKQPYSTDNPMPADLHFCGRWCMECALATRDLDDDQKERVREYLKDTLKPAKLKDRWDRRARVTRTCPDVDAFLAEVQAVCLRHGLSLSHEDGQGAFIVERRAQHLVDWLDDAMVDLTEEVRDAQ